MKEALDLGLVNFVWDKAELEGNLKDLIRELIELPMETIPRYKNLVNHSAYTGPEIHLDRERFSVSQLGGTARFRQRLDRLSAGRQGKPLP